MPEVVIDRVHKSYGKAEVLKGVSLSVERGEVTALIGRSGSGKVHAPALHQTGLSRSSRAPSWSPAIR